MMTSFWITNAGNPPIIKGDDSSASSSSSQSQVRCSTKSKPKAVSAKTSVADSTSLTHGQQPSKVQAKTHKGKKATGSVTTSPSESSTLTKPSSGAQLRATLKGKKMAGSTTSPPPSVIQQPTRAQKGKRTTGSTTINPATKSSSVTQQSSSTQVKTQKGKTATSAKIYPPSESSTSIIQQPSGAQKGKKTIRSATINLATKSASVTQQSSGTQVTQKGKKTATSAKINPAPELSTSAIKQASGAQKEKRTTQSTAIDPATKLASVTQQSSGTQVKTQKGNKTAASATISPPSESSTSVIQQPSATKDLPSAKTSNDHEPLAVDELLCNGDTEFSLLSDPDNTWIKELLLTKSDKSCIENPHGWLNDAIIHAAQSLLKCQSQREKSGVGGFQNPQFAKGYRFRPVEGKFVQVLHVSNSHWITISNIGCGSDSVNVFDSAYALIDMDGKKQVCSLMKPSGDVLFMDFVNIQHQGNGSDCGLFALACATDLVYDRDPFLSYWNTKEMRPHLVKCLETKQMTCFPLDKARRIPVRKRLKKSIKVNIHCICRMPYGRAELKMVCCDMCHKWFHCTCLQVEEGASLSDMHWECNQSTCKPKGRKSQR